MSLTTLFLPLVTTVTTEFYSMLVRNGVALPVAVVVRVAVVSSATSSSRSTPAGSIPGYKPPSWCSKCQKYTDHEWCGSKDELSKRYNSEFWWNALGGASVGFILASVFIIYFFGK